MKFCQKLDFVGKSIIFSSIVVGVQQNFTKFHKIYHQGYIWPGFFQNFRKISQFMQGFMQLGKVSSEISLESIQVLLTDHHTTGEIKVLLCIYVSFLRVEISVIITYIDIFQLKPVVKSDNIHHFTKISIFSLHKVEICSSKFQIGDSFSHFSYHTQLLTFLISHTISYCFSTRHAYLTPVPRSEQIIALFKSLGAIHMPECYTHAPIISGIHHCKW